MLASAIPSFNSVVSQVLDWLHSEENPSPESPDTTPERPITMLRQPPVGRSVVPRSSYAARIHRAPPGTSATSSRVSEEASSDFTNYLGLALLLVSPGLLILGSLAGCGARTGLENDEQEREADGSVRDASVADASIQPDASVGPVDAGASDALVGCMAIPDGTTGDLDGDCIPDPVDNCPMVPNPHQEDLDLDGFGDRCDEDADGDGLPELEEDLNGNGLFEPSFCETDPLNPDTDEDGLTDDVDPCPLDPDPICESDPC